MTITAKFASTCPCCSVRINVGDRIEWTKGSAARHPSCKSKPVTATVSRPAAYRPRAAARGARYCEGWGADNPHAPRAPYTCMDCIEH